MPASVLEEVLAWSGKVSSTSWDHVKSRMADCSGAGSPRWSWRMAV